MQKFLLAAATGGMLLVASPSHGQTIFSQDFNSQTAGNTVSGFTSVTPATATPPASGRGAVVATTGLPSPAMNVYDYDSVNSARVEQDFGPLSAAHLSLSFKRNADLVVDTTTESTRAFYVTMGLNGAAQNTQANRAIEFRLFNNGVYRMNRGVQDGSGNFVSTSLTPAANFEPSGATFNTFSLDLFVYSGLVGDATLPYTGPDSVARVLDPNSFSVFLNGVRVAPTSSATANDNFGIFNSAFYGTAANLGRIGFVSGGAAALVGMDFIVDDIVLSQIPVPEPSSLTLLGLGILALVWRRKVAVR
jgi:hypothetical protein